MTLSIFLSATLIFLIFYVSAPKNLHLFEILFCWMVIIFLHGTVMAHVILNYKTIELNPDLFLIWTFVFIRFVLMPLLIIWLIDLYSSVRSLSIKTMLTVIFTTALVGIEYFADWLEVIRIDENWKVWWSFIIWATIIFSVYTLNIWFRNIMKKEVTTT